MTSKQFRICWQEAAAYADADAYASDMALSSVWGDEPNSSVPTDRIVTLYNIWLANHINIKIIRKSTGLTQIAFGERFLIPRRTIQSWESGDRECPDYTRLLLMLAAGVYSREDLGIE